MRGNSITLSREKLEIALGFFVTIVYYNGLASIGIRLRRERRAPRRSAAVGRVNRDTTASKDRATAFCLRGSNVTSHPINHLIIYGNGCSGADRPSKRSILSSQTHTRDYVEVLRAVAAAFPSVAAADFINRRRAHQAARQPSGHGDEEQRKGEMKFWKNCSIH